MNKMELVAELARRVGLTKKQANMVIDELVDIIKDELRRGRSVRLIGFGTFTVRQRAARKGRNPRTREEITIPARKVPVFKPSNQLKDLVR